MVRIKICGITRAEDGAAAAALGADAVGLVFYPPSPRNVSLEQARAVIAALPPFVSVVALFVNPAREWVEQVLAACAVDVLQFHGEEEAEFCRSFRRPYLKAVRVRPGMDLLEWAGRYPDARGLLTDAFVEGAHGGTGATFDWTLLPEALPLPLILSGGLDESNIVEAVRRVKPAAVDVSSGVEASKGIKDAARMAAFISGARHGSV
ncbi:phosphoribosylanthranilate isomerase [Chromobacterium subtsugae]|uniref:N-(5'-phosphoribosyl)anthranilate isomerase n=1 Tax=Chromobacterium subtsugae TaxID=251747 RepID=A0ABS7FJC3_9NEIS|nr:MULTISPECIES: phosphoribosylanthranilate isomerase [Chromobacterium]KUM02904.1 N-(5'-phosphoribosyl)anthranilate isomerase [Chromobacterium subtsugae]KZE84120.1 N-(5'-phosphoribosyl)anthranilate isomerase [Chromobacterium sp. F49]MBW7568644.1 phosphoribosylanthranilate isomerase [Chromobacterium subtsugae]MBW8290157.1 phosphoribosylanthranilate isomerase [Chromobacterium subtsugae]OBU86019.1 N-(5'-phosphoribosyl)anthranilate isomerase [Chromobacterium subtsugae]